MKKTVYLLTLVSIITLTACGGSEGDEVTDQFATINTEGLEEISLVDYGYNLTIMVPKADLNGDAQVTLTERNSLEIVVGLNYGIEIMFGDGDIELLKSDLQDNFIFQSTILKEDTNSLIYSQNIPDSDIKTQNHFMYRAEIGADIYEVRDILEKEFGAQMIEKMVQSAQTLKESTSVKVEA